MVVTTQSIKYIGSKAKLIPNILEIIKPLGVRDVLDGFSGSTRVSQALAKSGYQVVSTDVAEYSAVLATCYLLNSRPKNFFVPIIEHLNSLNGVDGWFTENYGGLPESHGKKPFQIHNTRKIDAIRDEIDRLALSESERCVLLTSLMLAVDKVDNTLGHFTSYLQGWSKRSYNCLTLEVPDLLETQDEHLVYKSDIFSILPTIEKTDLAYYDPPYGSNNVKMPSSRVRYSGYYHFYTTLCLNDKPELYGKVGRRVDSSDSVGLSVFESVDSGVVADSFRRLLGSTISKYILLSYNNKGRLSIDDLYEICKENSDSCVVYKTPHRANVMSHMKWTNEWVVNSGDVNTEFLFLLYR